MTEETQKTHTQLKIEDIREDIAKLQTKLTELEAREAAEALTDNVAVGDTVTAKYGRGDKVRTITGKVLAIGNDEKQGKLLALQVGEGLDVSTVKVRASDLQLGA